MNIAPTVQAESLSFSALTLREGLLKNVSSLGYEHMTPIQAQSLPLMLDRHDVVAQAKTGSGKTVAFGLSLLNHLQVETYQVQALVLCPTRELAEQVSQVLRQLARLMPNVKVLNVSGGMPMRPQVDSLKHGAHIVVGTPGRIQKHLDKQTLSLKYLQTLILDEADRMLDMGFFDAIEQIIRLCPQQRQTLMFSATYPLEIKKLCDKFMQNSQKISVEEAHSELEIEQIFYEVTHPSNKFAVLKTLLQQYQPKSTLIFCNTKEQTYELAAQLTREGFSAIALNGDMEQMERDLAIIRFKNQSCSILVATDVAARGLDIKELPAVINFELAFDHDVHVHRIGRTGRAGSKGLALSLTTPADAHRLCLIEHALQRPVLWGKLSESTKSPETILAPEMITVCLNAGRKDKIRPGDILGALTKDGGLAGDMIGQIDITPLCSYVAIHRSQLASACEYLKHGKLKGRKISARVLK